MSSKSAIAYASLLGTRFDSPTVAEFVDKLGKRVDLRKRGVGKVVFPQCGVEICTENDVVDAITLYFKAVRADDDIPAIRAAASWICPELQGMTRRQVDARYDSPFSITEAEEGNKEWGWEGHGVIYFYKDGNRQTSLSFSNDEKAIEKASLVLLHIRPEKVPARIPKGGRKRPTSFRASASDLSELVGLKRSNKRVRAVLSTLGDPADDYDDVGELAFYPESGVCFTFLHRTAPSQLDQIDFHSQGHEECDAFLKPLFEDVQFGMTRTRVNQEMGPPTHHVRKGEYGIPFKSSDCYEREWYTINFVYDRNKLAHVQVISRLQDE